MLLCKLIEIAILTQVINNSFHLVYQSKPSHVLQLWLS